MRNNFKMRQFHFLSLIVALSAFETTATHVLSKRQSACSAEFIQSGDSYTATSNISHIVSQGRVCTLGSQNPIEFCNVQTGGLVKEEPTFEIGNTSYIDPNYFCTLLAFVAQDSTWGGRSSDELYGRPQYANATLEEGQAAYLAFTATLTCFEGTLCHAEGNITEPTNARACFPSLNGVSYTDEMNGTTTLVTTDEETARDVGGNPAVETEYDYLESMEPDDEGIAGALDVELAKRYAVFMFSIATFAFLGF